MFFLEWKCVGAQDGCLFCSENVWAPKTGVSLGVKMGWRPKQVSLLEWECVGAQNRWLFWSENVLAPKTDGSFGVRMCWRPKQMALLEWECVGAQNRWLFWSENVLAPKTGVSFVEKMGWRLTFFPVSSGIKLFKYAKFVHQYDLQYSVGEPCCWTNTFYEKSKN